MEYRSTAKGEMFPLYDSGPDPERILIFGTCQNVDMLINSQHWLADGTFKTAPTLFQQVYVIHALRGEPNPLLDGHVLPSLFVLLPNKTQVTYTRMWNQEQCILDYPDSLGLNKTVRISYSPDKRGRFIHSGIGMGLASMFG